MENKMSVLAFVLLAVLVMGMTMLVLFNQALFNTLLVLFVGMAGMIGGLVFVTGAIVKHFRD
jgi:hypothetical protein